MTDNKQRLVGEILKRDSIARDELKKAIEKSTIRKMEMEEMETEFVGNAGEISLTEIVKIGLLLTDDKNDFGSGFVVARNEKQYKSGIVETLWITGSGQDCVPMEPGDRIIRNFWNDGPEDGQSVYAWLVESLAKAGYFGYCCEDSIKSFVFLYNDL